MSTVILVGPGRAGLSLLVALQRAGHSVAAVVARDRQQAAAAASLLGTTAVEWAGPLPAADLVVLGVRDDAIAEVAEVVAPTATDVTAAVHLSGLAGLELMAPFVAVGIAVGSFHPLQTLPDPQSGADRIRGAWIAVDAGTDSLRNALQELAESMGATPFDVDSESRAAYHAAAAAAANFPLAALAMAEDLFAAAGVPFAAAQPLVAAVIENAFVMGPRPALTGPVARGDVGTVRSQLEAVRRYAPQWEDAFRSFVAVLADMTGQQMDVG
jgi:predicted short-subunit dehydrogenase-like oxidoreductase (DUF2520 family)